MASVEVRRSEEMKFPSRFATSNQFSPQFVDVKTFPSVLGPDELATAKAQSFAPQARATYGTRPLGLRSAQVSPLSNETSTLPM
jgi:hypothetical protein